MMRSSQYRQSANPMRQAHRNTVKKQRVPNAERRRASIEAVLDSALQLFVTQGYDATSMDDIAGNAGLTNWSKCSKILRQGSGSRTCFMSDR